MKFLRGQEIFSSIDNFGDVCVVLLRILNLFFYNIKGA